MATPFEIVSGARAALRDLSDRGLLRATGADFERLNTIVEALGHATDDAARQHHHDAFHAALFEATHNPFLASFGLILYRFFWGLAAHAPGVTSVSVSRMAPSHRALLTGLMTRDESLIPRLVAQHLGSVTPMDILDREVTV